MRTPMLTELERQVVACAFAYASARGRDRTAAESALRTAVENLDWNAPRRYLDSAYPDRRTVRHVRRKRPVQSVDILELVRAERAAG